MQVAVDFVADGNLVARAKEQEASPAVLLKLPGGGSEVFGGPALGATEGGAGADADERAGAEAIAALLARSGGPVETDEGFGGEAIDEAGAAEQLEVMEALVGRGVAGGEARDAVGEHPAAAIAIEADAAGDAGEPGGEG